MPWVCSSGSLKLAGIGLRPGRSAQTSCGLNLLEGRLVNSHTTVIIPLEDRVLFVSSLNCAEFSSRLSEVAQTLDALRRVTGVVGELYAVCVSASW
jgi:hypothetical protein